MATESPFHLLWRYSNNLDTLRTLRHKTEAIENENFDIQSKLRNLDVPERGLFVLDQTGERSQVIAVHKGNHCFDLEVIPLVYMHELRWPAEAEAEKPNLPGPEHGPRGTEGLS